MKSLSRYLCASIDEMLAIRVALNINLSSSTFYRNIHRRFPFFFSLHTAIKGIVLFCLMPFCIHINFMRAATFHGMYSGLYSMQMANAKAPSDRMESVVACLFSHYVRVKFCVMVDFMYSPYLCNRGKNPKNEKHIAKICEEFQPSSRALSSERFNVYLRGITCTYTFYTIWHVTWD